jgi:hypothetical protein
MVANVFTIGLGGKEGNLEVNEITPSPEDSSLSDALEKPWFLALMVIGVFAALYVLLWVPYMLGANQ